MYARASRNVRKKDGTFAERSTGFQPPLPIIKVGFSAISAFFRRRAAFSACFSLISFREPLFDPISAVFTIIKVGFSAISVFFRRRAAFSARFNLISFREPLFDPISAAFAD
jgi:hypothetical protein